MAQQLTKEEWIAEVKVILDGYGMDDDEYAVSLSEIYFTDYTPLDAVHEDFSYGDPEPSSDE